MADIFGDIFGAASSLLGGFGTFQSSKFAAQGYSAAAAAYGQGANYAALNAALERESTSMQLFGEQRLAAKTAGAQMAAAAANGMGPAGSALSLLRETKLQSGLAQQMIEAQGAINENQYLAEQQALLGEEGAATAAGKAASSSGMTGLFGGILGAAGKILGGLL